MRLILDAAKRFTVGSNTLINMMTSTRFGTEILCLYGDTFIQLLECIYDLCITYPLLDIVLHTNDVKSCFKQLKLHSDIMPAFSIIIADFCTCNPHCRLPLTSHLKTGNQYAVWLRSLLKSYSMIAHYLQSIANTLTNSNRNHHWANAKLPLYPRKHIHNVWGCCKQTGPPSSPHNDSSLMTRSMLTSTMTIEFT